MEGISGGWFGWVLKWQRLVNGVIQYSTMLCIFGMKLACPSLLKTENFKNSKNIFFNTYKRSFFRKISFEMSYVYST